MNSSKALRELAKESREAENKKRAEAGPKERVEGLTEDQKVLLRYSIKKRKEFLANLEESRSSFSRPIPEKTKFEIGVRLAYHGENLFQGTELITRQDICIRALLRLPYDFPVSTLNLELILDELDQ